jgi:hypothetical protein
MRLLQDGDHEYARVVGGVSLGQIERKLACGKGAEEASLERVSKNTYHEVGHPVFF